MSAQLGEPMSVVVGMGVKTFGWNEKTFQPQASKQHSSYIPLLCSILFSYKSHTSTSAHQSNGWET